MPNPNVEKLFELLQEGSIRRHDPGEQAVNRALARFLASRGVLVISDAVLTDEAVEALAPIGETGEWESCDQVREFLGGIAKGEDGA